MFSTTSASVRVRPLAPGDTAERGVFRELMEKLHYLKSDTLVGEQLRYVAEVDGRQVALLSWSAAANALLVLSMVRRAALGNYLHWRKRFKNKRQSTVKDFHDAMNRFNNRLAFATITAH